MRKCFIGLGHFVDLIAFANGISLSLIRFEDFCRQSFLHRDAFAGIGKINQPAQGERELTVRRDFERNLVSGAADAAGLKIGRASCRERV